MLFVLGAVVGTLLPVRVPRVVGIFLPLWVLVVVAVVRGQHFPFRNTQNILGHFDLLKIFGQTGVEIGTHRCR